MKTIKAILFDFGGVLAEEGFKEGLEAIARQEGLEPESLFLQAQALIYSTGYVLGRSDESTYWRALKKKTGLQMTEADLHRAVLSRFILRPAMIILVQDLRKKGTFVGILSDQTDWLEELDRKMGIYKHFDRVFNSFRLHKSKKDPAWFEEICSDLGLIPSEVLFIDDQADNISRAAAVGLKTIHFRHQEQFREDLAPYLDFAAATEESGP